MLIRPKFCVFAFIVVLLSSGCTVLDKFPDQAETAKPLPPVKKAPASSPKEKSPTSSAEEESPTSQLAAMHDSSKLDIAWVFQYYRLISTVPPKVLNDEFERTKKDFSADKTTWNQWQLAMLLSLPSAPFYEPERSTMLFKELVDSPADQDPVINDAAFLMYSWVKEQHHITKRAADLEAQLAESRSANKTLQDQLDALKAIEENLYHRNKLEVLPKP
jgi:hypothetical protein